MANKTVDEYLDCARCPNRIIFGDAYLSISNNHIPRFMATGGKYVFSNYSPLIKFKDDNLYHIFKQRFADDINWVNQNRNNYGLNYIND